MTDSNDPYRFRGFLMEGRGDSFLSEWKDNSPVEANAAEPIADVFMNFLLSKVIFCKVIVQL